MARIGYARVSTIDQDLETQLTKLRAEGCEVIRSEKMSGASREAVAATGFRSRLNKQLNLIQSRRWPCAAPFSDAGVVRR